MLHTERNVVIWRVTVLISTHFHHEIATEMRGSTKPFYLKQYASYETSSTQSWFYLTMKFYYTGHTLPYN
jgi:hypothetical protein